VDEVAVHRRPLIEPPQVWTGCLPAKYREIGPHIVELDPKDAGAINVAGMDVQQDGRSKPIQQWKYEDRLYPNIGLNAVAGKPREQYGCDPVRFDEMTPAVTTRSHASSTWTSTVSGAR